jgi:hypothetical protein
VGLTIFSAKLNVFWNTRNLAGVKVRYNRVIWLKLRACIPYLLAAKRKGHKPFLRTDNLAVAADGWHVTALRREQVSDHPV